MVTATSRQGNLLKKTIEEFIEDDCMSMAAAIAYYTIFSLPPLLIIVLSICTAYFDPEDVRGRLAGQIEVLMGPDGAKQIREMLAHADQPGRGTIATILGVFALVFGATGAVGQLQYSLNRAWEVEPDPEQGGIKNFILKRLLSLAMVVVIGFLLLVSLVINVAISTFGDKLGGLISGSEVPSLVRAINTGATILIVPVLFAAMFKILPDAHLSWRDVWLGSCVTTILSIAGKFAIGAYVGQSDPGSAYGAAGSLAIVLLWVYYSALVVLLGAEFTQVWAKRRGKHIEPSEGATHFVETHERVDE